MRVRTVQEILPVFVTELENLTVAAGRADLVQQIRSLPILDRCDCGQGNCAHFYTEPKPAGSYGPGHTNLLLPSERGLIVYSRRVRGGPVTDNFMVCPPLIVTREQIAEIMALLVDTLEALAGEFGLPVNR